MAGSYRIRQHFDRSNSGDFIGVIFQIRTEYGFLIIKKELSHTVVCYFILFEIVSVGFFIGREVYKLQWVCTFFEFFHQVVHCSFSLGEIFSGRFNIKVDVNNFPRFRLFEALLMFVVIFFDLPVAYVDRRIFNCRIVFDDITDVGFISTVGCCFLCLGIRNIQRFGDNCIVFRHFPAVGNFFFHVQPICFLRNIIGSGDYFFYIISGTGIIDFARIRICKKLA